jgi:hypothetical protein
MRRRHGRFRQRDETEGDYMAAVSGVRCAQGIARPFCPLRSTLTPDTATKAFAPRFNRAPLVAARPQTKPFTKDHWTPARHSPTLRKRMKIISKATIDQILNGEAPSCLALGVTAPGAGIHKLLTGSAANFPANELGITKDELQRIVDALGPQGVRGLLLGLYLAPNAKSSSAKTQTVSVIRK